MNHFLKITTSIAIAAFSFAAPARAVPISDGTVSVANLFIPAINLTTDPASYSVSFGSTVQVQANGGFASANGLLGTFNGTILFSEIAGDVIQQTIPDLFVFADGTGGTYNFSVTSILTRSFVDNPGVTTSGSLYALGNVLNTTLGFEATPAGLTISFNSTGGSPYISAETLAVPPADAVPEPAMLGLFGLGAVGLVLARRRKAA